MNVLKPDISVAPPVGSVPRVISYVASGGVAALGPHYAAIQKAVSELVKSWSPKWMVFGGDNVWPDTLQSSSDAAWDPYQQEIDDEKVFPVCGVVELARGYPITELARFPYLPGNRTTYVVRDDLVSIYVLNTESTALGVDAISDQNAWLDRELSNSPTHWNIVFQYGAGWSNEIDLVPGDARHRWAAEKPGVDLVVCGRPKVYERFKVGGSCMVVNAGIGGSPLSAFSVSPVQAPLAQSSVHYGAVRITVYPDRIVVAAIEPGGEFPIKFDEVVIIKASTQKFRPS